MHLHLFLIPREIQGHTVPHWKYLSYGTLAEAWRGGIGKYPPHPERLPMSLRCLKAKQTDEGRHWQPRRIRWVFSNTSEPGLCHCHCDIVKNKYSYIDQCTPPDISKIFFVCCQEVYIDQCKPPDNSKIDFTIVNRCTLINVHLLGRYT